MTDSLTGLLDRWQFLDILKHEVRKANEHQTTIGLLVLEVKDFRRINTLYGYTAGDQVLQAFAEVLLQVSRKQDYPARIGDSQFALLLNGILSEEHAKLAAFKIQRLLENPVEFGFDKIRCVASIGIALCPMNASEPEDLLREGEKALDSAKQSDQLIGIVEKRDEDSISDNWDIEVELVNAIDNSQLEVYFQPKISVVTGTPTGAEALIRWQSPTRGLVGPNLFIPVAESTGFIKPLTNWMLNSALRLSSEWTERWGDLKVSVNIPTRLLEQPDFVDIVLSAQGLWKKKGITLCLEILEQSFISDVSSCFKILKDLQSAGIEISIDDFGTGYSSLSYFRDIPANELKIDQSFVMGLLDDKANENIVGLIIDLAHRFDLTVVAEGVENAEIMSVIQSLECDEVQGYYFSKPMPAEQFNHWLENFDQIILI